MMREVPSFLQQRAFLAVTFFSVLTVMAIVFHGVQERVLTGQSTGDTCNSNSTMGQGCSNNSGCTPGCCTCQPSGNTYACAPTNPNCGGGGGPVCGNGVVEQGEACGEPGISCGANQMCVGCSCTPLFGSSSSGGNNSNGGGSSQGGGGSSQGGGGSSQGGGGSSQGGGGSSQGGGSSNGGGSSQGGNSSQGGSSSNGQSSSPSSQSSSSKPSSSPKSSSSKPASSSSKSSSNSAKSSSVNNSAPPSCTPPGTGCSTCRCNGCLPNCHTAADGSQVCLKSCGPGSFQCHLSNGADCCTFQEIQDEPPTCPTSGSSSSNQQSSNSSHSSQSSPSSQSSSSSKSSSQTSFLSSRASSPSSCGAGLHSCADCQVRNACWCYTDPNRPTVLDANGYCYPQATACTPNFCGSYYMACGPYSVNGSPIPPTYSDNTLCTPCTAQQQQAEQAACISSSSQSNSSGGNSSGSGNSSSNSSGSSQGSGGSNASGNSSNGNGSSTSNGQGFCCLANICSGPSPSCTHANCGQCQALSSASSASSSSTGGSCTTNEQCPANNMCQNGICIPTSCPLDACTAGNGQQFCAASGHPFCTVIPDLPCIACSDTPGGSSQSSASSQVASTGSSSSAGWIEGFCCLRNRCVGPERNCTNANCGACTGSASSGGSNSSNGSTGSSSSAGVVCPADSCSARGGQEFCTQSGHPFCTVLNDLPCIACSDFPTSSSRASQFSQLSVSCLHICGNTTRECAEECDDGNLRNDDGCDNSCRFEGGFCGDGIIQSRRGENCEPTLTDPSSDCNQVTCTLIHQASSAFPVVCGDGVRQGTEECDSGGGSASCDASCHLKNGFCGDNIVQSGRNEDCEPSLTSGNALYHCSATCRLVPNALASSSARSAFSATSNTSDVGIVCTGRECADGGDLFCKEQDMHCVTVGVLPCLRCVPKQATAQATSEKPACTTSADCRVGAQCVGGRCIVAPACVTDADCLTGNRCVSGVCLTATQVASLPYYCGNAHMDAGEECDLGTGNSLQPNALCRPDCTLSRCGDSVIDMPFESCDDGAFNGQPGSACDMYCNAGHLSTGVLPANIISLPFTTGLSTGGNSPTGGAEPGTSSALQPPSSPIPPNTPSSGPETVLVMAAGASAGYAWMKRRRSGK